MNLAALGALIGKDVRLFFGDKRALNLSILAPIVIGSFFGFLFGGSNREKAGKIAIEIVDLDGTAVSRSVAARLSSDAMLDVTPAELEAARMSVQKGKVSVAVVLPRGFGDRAGSAFFGGGDKPEVSVLFDPSHSMELGVVRGLLTQAAMEVVSQEMLSGATGQSTVRDALARLGSTDMPPPRKAALSDLLHSVDQWNEESSKSPATGRGLSLPYELKEEPVTSRVGQPSYNGYAHSFAGMGVQFILFMGVDAGIALLMLRRSSIWNRLRAAPIGRRGILLARAISAALLASFIMLVIFSFARLAFQVKIEGSLAGFLGVTVAFGFMTATFGLLIAALGKTPEAARGLAIFGTLIMVMLGGAWIPLSCFLPGSKRRRCSYRPDGPWTASTR